MYNKKIYKSATTIGNLIEIVKKAKRQGLKIVTTNGAFDILHVGHVRNLEFAKSLGDILVVGVNSDASARAYKGRNRPIMPELERAEMVASLKSVDYVFIFSEETPIPWLKKLKPHIHVKGRDRTLDQIIERETLKEIGTKFVFAPFIKGKSSTNIIEKIKNL